MNTELQRCIIDKATLLFYQYGLRSITMDFIAGELGISKRTLYENFSSKETLVIACMNEMKERQEKEVSEILNKEYNVLEKIVRLYELLITVLNKTSHSFIIDIERMHSTANTEYEEQQKRAIIYIRDLFKQGVDEGVIRDDIDIEIAAILHNSQIDWFKKAQSPFATGYRPGEIIRTIVLIFLRGIATPEGSRILDEITKDKLQASKIDRYQTR